MAGAFLTSDLDSFFSTDEFAITATIGGGSVKGIFDAAYADEMGIGGVTPRLRCKSSDVSSVIRGSVAVIEAKTYVVKEHREDGRGTTTLILNG